MVLAEVGRMSSQRVGLGILLMLPIGCGKAEADADAQGTDDGLVSAGTADPGETGGTAGADAADSAGTAGAGDGTAADEAGGDDAGGDDGPPVVFDLGSIPDAGPFGNCTSKGGKDGEPEFSYLWAANSAQGTISKIDTQTVTEVGRYLVRPDGFGSPSRTSVSLSGHVAVANRSGGITKIYATPELCQDTNGTPGIQTSADSNYLPWGEEECVAWYAPFPYQSQRPVAWVQGELEPTTCQYVDERLWTSGMTGGSIDVLLLDGETGVVMDMVNVAGLVADSYGLYGGAVDGEGNFWATQLGTANKLVRVDIDDLSYEIWNPPSGPWWYGMTVDSEGFVWMCGDSVGRFDPMTETFMTSAVGGYTGCMAETGADGLLWMSTGGGVIGVNRQNLQVEKTWSTPGSYGVSIDFYGYVWTVANGNSAHRVDPDTGQVTSYNGLYGAYTYSDMTGYALSHAGGGAPSG
jgi:hypothetical protein